MQGEVEPVEEQTSEHDRTQFGDAQRREVDQHEVERHEVSGVAGARRAYSTGMR